MAFEPRHGTRTAAALLVAVALLWIGGCGDNPRVTPIEGPGGLGDIAGRVDFQGYDSPPYPTARIQVSAPTAGTCTSQFQKIQIAGEFTSWDLTQAPTMTQDKDCVWLDTLTVAAGTYLFKFVTNGAFDNPQDYGGSESTTLIVPGTFPVQPVSGQGTALKITVKTTGEYQITLDEGTGECTFGPPGGETGGLVLTSDPETGEFRFADVPVGLYEVTVTSTGYLTERFNDVTVRHNRKADLGDIHLAVPGGALKGEVAFEGNPSPKPTATVTVYHAGTSNVAHSTTTSGAFAITGLSTGDYDVLIAASGWATVRRNAVRFTNGTDTDLGTITLAELAGKLSGVVEFADHPYPRPTATVKVRRTGATGDLETVETDSAFVFKGLGTGSYDIIATAPGYTQARENSIAYVQGDITDIGAITLVPGCESAFNKIQIAGAFTSWDLNLAPAMTRLPDCKWIDTLSVQPGSYFFKFVTNGAFDSPLDYGGSEGTTLPLPGTYPVKAVSGQGTALSVSFLNAGDYVFELDESALQFKVTLLGQVPTGSIKGTVSYAGLSEGPYPQATVDLYQGTATTPLLSIKSDAATRAFQFQTLPNGTYKVEVSSPCFIKETRSGVTVSGAEVDLGAISLAAGTSAFTTIQIAGELTSWDLPEALQMTQSPPCVWTATLQVSPGTYFFKFVTNGNFDDPKDYGGDESVTLSLPGSYPIRPVSGQGTALKAQFSAPGQYLFTLDERRQQFTVTAQ